jgi:hypothetical protein
MWRSQLDSNTKHASHPSGQTITFTEDDHRYVVDQTGETLTSVTTFIGNFFPKFDTDAIAPKCVGKPKYKGMTVDEIKQAWADEALRGSTEGTNTHWYAECFCNGDINKLPEPQSEREGKLFKQVALAVLALEERFIFIEAEKIVFSTILGIAGTIDLLMLDPDKNDLIILDWKQNKKISTSNSWDNARKPIDHLEACDYSKYCLQLNTYEKILTTDGYLDIEGGLNGVRKALIHLTEDNFSFLKIGDFQKEVSAMLEDIPF